MWYLPELSDQLLGKVQTSVRFLKNMKIMVDRVQIRRRNMMARLRRKERKKERKKVNDRANMSININFDCGNISKQRIFMC